MMYNPAHARHLQTLTFRICNAYCLWRLFCRVERLQLSRTWYITETKIKALQNDTWPYSVHVGFGVDKVALGEICLQVPWFPPGTVIPPLFCIYISFIYHYMS